MRPKLPVHVVSVLIASTILATTSIRADAILENFDHPQRIPGQYIVVLKNDESMGCRRSRNPSV
jgi:hypothetical protein